MAGLSLASCWLGAPHLRSCSGLRFGAWLRSAPFVQADEPLGNVLMGGQPHLVSSSATTTATRQPSSSPQSECPQNVSNQRMTSTAPRTADPNIIFRGDKRLIPTRREPGQLHFQKIQLVHDLREIIAGLGGLAEGEAVGIEVACVAVGLPLLVAYCRLIPDYREWLRTLISRMKSIRASQFVVRDDRG
jgi:hypothetical protein